LKLTVVYSFSGNAYSLAEAFANESGATLCRVTTAKPLGKVGAYTYGCFCTLRGKPIPIIGMPEDATAFEGEIDVFAPVWAGGAAAPILSALSRLAKDTAVRLHMVSASGKSNKDAIIAAVTALGLRVTAYADIQK